MDKTWMRSNRLSKEYEKGVWEFVEFAVKHSEDPLRMPCPCLGCCYGGKVDGKQLGSHYYGLELIEVIHVGQCMVRKVTGMLSRGVIGSMLQTTIAQTHTIAIESKRLQKRLKKILRIVPKCLRGW